MQTLIYGAYIRVWPIITLVVLIRLCAAVRKDVRAAKKAKPEPV